ncbi:MAG: hypothetical protein A2521_15940 [Deltaproteobacteria bacterium RIFOXYD12_FULL_57_12]|nr:MAG: hypothetical protein A2521_15940 [Deltaproteobacteria bacterium RIFOXYD12_FULL_57_12]
MSAEEIRPDLEHIRKRVREKTENYERYNFSQTQNNLLKCFFDLAQEYDSLQDLYRICVAVPLEYMAVETALYLLDDEEKNLRLVCNSREGIITDKRPVPTGIYLADEPYLTQVSYIVPIYRKPPPNPAAEAEAAAEFPAPSLVQEKSRIMGMFEIFATTELTPQEQFFLTKYTNRIGFRLHNRLVALQNIRHLKFINSLVMDIEHNVIIPNMYFRHLFNQLKKKIVEMEGLEKMMRSIMVSSGAASDECNGIIERVVAMRTDLAGYHREIQKHHANVSLFLESLFRREHFEKGHLVLQPKRCFLEKEIIEPQLEQYQKRLQATGITVLRPTDMTSVEFPIMVDVGLLAQVYANFFSNAAKYAETIIDYQGLPRKTVAYGRELLFDFFGPGQDGIKFNVFSTGPHLCVSDREILFTEGGRCSNSQRQPGTGHGLSFIKHVIEMHGGRVGYEPTEEGNNFYIILPLPITKPYSMLPMTLSLV